MPGLAGAGVGVGGGAQAARAAAHAAAAARRGARRQATRHRLRKVRAYCEYRISAMFVFSYSVTYLSVKCLEARNDLSDYLQLE